MLILIVDRSAYKLKVNKSNIEMIQPPFSIPDRIHDIIYTYYQRDSIAFTYYYTHCVKVTELALILANNNNHLNLDTEFILYGSMLHDIGIIHTNAPEIGCFGEFPYIAHTYLGRQMLEKEGLPGIALVCERHIGTGLSKEDIIAANFPLPHYDMLPISYEEKLICYADKFYSKSEKHLTTPRTVEKIRKKILKYGEDKLEKFDDLVTLFGPVEELI